MAKFSFFFFHFVDIRKFLFALSKTSKCRATELKSAWVTYFQVGYGICRIKLIIFLKFEIAIL